MPAGVISTPAGQLKEHRASAWLPTKRSGQRGAAAAGQRQEGEDRDWITTP